MYTMNPIEEDISVPATHNGNPCDIFIDKSTET